MEQEKLIWNDAGISTDIIAIKRLTILHELNFIFVCYELHIVDAYSGRALCCGQTIPGNIQNIFAFIPCYFFPIICDMAH